MEKKKSGSRRQWTCLVNSLMVDPHNVVCKEQDYLNILKRAQETVRWGILESTCGLLKHGNTVATHWFLFVTQALRWLCFWYHRKQASSTGVALVMGYCIKRLGEVQYRCQHGQSGCYYQLITRIQVDLKPCVKMFHDDGMEYNGLVHYYRNE